VEPYFQVGLAVPDLEAAMREVGSSLGVQMIGPLERDLGDGTLRIAFARTPPPYLELLEGPPGSIWDAAGGAKMHHLGHWSEDLDADGARLEEAGIPLELDLGFARYYGPAPATGARVELIDIDYRPEFLARWSLPER
jgi:Glyoxalase/Bleomycin resistance protein/Dioxygenase superfamily